MLMNYEHGVFNITPLFQWKSPLNQQALPACVFMMFLQDKFLLMKMFTLQNRCSD